MSDIKLVNKVNKVCEAWDRHHHIQAGDAGVYTTEADQKIDVKVHSLLTIDFDGSTRYQVVDSQGMQYIVRPDQLTIEPVSPIVRLLTEDLADTLTMIAHRISYSTPRIVKALRSYDPVTATQSQYEAMNDWLQLLDNLMKENPVLKSSSFVVDLREAVRLWLVRSVDIKFGGK